MCADIRTNKIRSILFFGLSLLGACFCASARDAIVCDYAFSTHIQGATCDGTHLFVVAKNEILKADLTGATVKALNTSSDHHGDPTLVNGKLYVPVNRGEFSKLGEATCYVEVYDAATLTLEKTYGPFYEPIYGAGGMTYRNGSFYIVGGLPDDGTENLIFEYVEEDGRFRFVRRHTLPIYTGKGIQTATVIDDRFWFGVDTPYSGGAALNPIGTLVCSTDFADYHRTDFQGPWGIVRVGDDIGYIPYSSSTCTVKFDYDFTKPYTVGYIAGRADSETVSANPLDVNELILASGSSRTGTVTVSTNLTVCGTAKVGTFAGGFGTLTLKGGSLSLAASSGGTCLTVGVNGAVARAGELSGWGAVSSTAATTSLAVYDRLVADGFGEQRDLDLSALTGVVEPASPSAAVAPGWYARNGGRLLLPVRSAAVTSSKLQNAVTSSLTGLSVALCAPDRADIPAAPELDWLTVWRVGSSASLTTASLSFVHAFSAAETTKTVSLYRHDGTSWTKLRDLTAAELSSGSFSVSSLTPTADATWNLGFFALAVPRGTVFYGNKSVDLAAATGWYTDPARTVASGVAPCASTDPSLPNVYLMNNDVAKTSTKADPVSFAGDIFQLGDADTAATLYTMNGTFSFPSFLFYGGELTLNNNGTVVLNGSYRFAESANTISLGAKSVSTKSRNLTLSGTFAAPAGVTVHCSSAYGATRTKNTTFLLSGDFSGFAGSLRFETPANATAEYPLEIELTAPSALGDEAFPRADALVLTDLCVLRPAADVSFSRTRGIRLELADGETATVDVPSGSATLAAPVSGAATGSFVKTGVGTLVLDGSYAAADITVSAGTLVFGADAFFPRATQVTVSPGAAITGTVPRNVSVFKVGQLTWIGEGADDRFTTPENWEGGVVPSLAANEGPLAVAGGLAAVVDTPAQFPSVSFSGYAFSFSGSERLTLTGSAHEFQESGSYAFDAPLTLTGTQDWTLPTDTAVSFGGSVTATGPVAFASPLSASVTLTGDNTALTGALSFTNIHLRLSGTAPLGPGSTKVSLGYSSGDEFGEGDADNAVVTALAPGLSLARPLAVAPSAKTTARRYVYRAQAGSTNTLASFDFYSSLGGTTKYLLTFEAGSRTRFDTLCGKSANSIQLAGAGEVEFDGWTLSGSLKTGRLETSGDGLLVRVAGPFDRNNGMELAAGDTLRLSVADAMPVAKAASAAGTTVVIDGTLDLAGNDQTILNLSGAGRVVSSAGTATLALTNGTGAALTSGLSFATNVSVSILSDAFTFTGASDSDGVLTLGGTAAFAFNGSGSWKGGALDLVGDASTVAPATDGSSYVKELRLNGTKLADGLYGAGSAAAVAAGVSARFTGTGLLQVGGTPPGPGPEPEPEKDTGTINLKTDRTISYEDVTATPSLLVTNYTSASGATLTLDATSAFTLSGALSGNLALVKAGGNKLTLSCTTNTYSGGTSLQKDAICITAGTSVPGSGALGTGKVTIQTAKSSSNGQLYIQGVTGDATIPNDLHFLGTASTDYGHQTSQGNVYLAAGGDVSVTLSGTVTAASGCGFSLATSRIGGNLTLAGTVNAPGATIYPTAYKGSTISFNGPVTAGVVDCGYYGDNHYGTVQLGSGQTHTLGELRVGHQNVKLNGTLADGCVLSWPLADEKTTLAGCSILTLGANVTADRLTSATLTTAQAARNTFAITGSGRTLTFKPSAALAETYVAVSGSVSVALQALDKTYVQAFLARKSVTSGKLNVQKGVLRLGTGASFPNVTDITVGKDGTFDLASIAANPVSAAATLRLTTGATLKVATGVTLTVDKLFVDGSAAAASAVTVTGGGTLVVKTAPAPVETVVTIPSGCLTTNDLSFVTAPSKLLIGYGTLRYVGAATTIPGLTFDPTVSYRASVISNHTDLVLGSLVNKDAMKGALIKYGQGTLTLGGTDKVTLKGYGPRNGNTKTKVLVDGNSQDSNFATLTVNEGELAIGATGDAANAPTIELHGLASGSGWIAGISAGGTDLRDDATISFRNGVVTNAGNVFAGFYYPATSGAIGATKTVTLRWCGGRTYGINLYGRYIESQASYVYGRSDLLVEAGEAVFSGDAYLCHSKGTTGENNRARLLVSGGRLAVAGNVFASAPKSYAGADVLIALSGGEFSVGGTFDLLSNTSTASSTYKSQRVSLVLSPGGLLRYGALIRSGNGTYCNETGVLVGDGGVLMPHNAVTNLSTLAHVYASTNGLVVSTADLDAAAVYEIAQAIESDPALVAATRVDGGLVKKGTGTLKLAAANTFTGPVRVEAGTLLLATAGAVNATNDLYLTTGAALQIPSGVSITVNRAYVDGVQVAAAAVPVSGGGTLVVTDEPVSADVYFDSSAAAGGTGTQERPFKTPVDFDFSRLAAGGRAYFRRGSVFRGPVTVRGVCGEAGNPVVLCAYGTGARPVFEGDNAIDTNVLTLADCDYLTVTDFEIRDTVGTAATNRCGVALFVSESESTDVRVSHEIVLTNLYIHTIRGLTAGENSSAALKRTGGIQVWSSASSRFDGLEIVGNTITNVDSTGIAIWRMPVIGGTPIPSPWNSATEFARTAHTNVRIAFNDVSDIGKNAIVVRNLKGGVVERNVVHDTSVRTLRENYVVGGNAIFTSYVDGTVIQYNEGYRNCANASDGAFLDADLHSKDTVWQYNYSHDNRFGLFICCTYKKDNPIVRGNLSVNDQGAYHGILSLNYVCTNLLFYNNTIITGPTTTNVFDIFSNATGHCYRVFNNVICNRSPYARICCPVDEDRANGEWKNNLVFNAPGAQVVSTGAYDPRTVYPNAVISTADPKFATAPADTLAGRCGWSAVEVAIPADDSPVFGLGEPVDLETDIFGRVWRQTLGCVAQLPEGSSWTSLKSGNWSVGSNWASGTAPDSVNAHVGLEALGAGADDPLIVTVDKNVAAAEVAVRSAAYGLAGTHVLTLGTAEESGVMSVSGTAGELTVGVPVCAAGGVRLNDFASAAEVAAAGRVNWQATSLTGGPLVLGAGVTDFSSAAALTFVSANDQLVLGRGTARFACGSVSLAGFTLGYEGMNGLSVAADETLTVATVATAGRGYNGLYKYGSGTLKFGGTGTSTIGGGQFSAFVAATEATAGVSPNGNAPTNGLMSVEIADGAVVLGTLDDAANAPIVKVANGMAVGCKNGPLGVEPTSGSLIINNGSFEVLKGTTYLGYYAGRTNDVGTAAPSITVNGGTLKMGGDFRVNYAANTSRIKCTPTFTINGGTVETLGTVGTGDCTIGKNYPIVFAMNGGVWHIYGNFYSSSRGSSSPLTFYGDGGKLTVDKSFDPNYAQTQGGDYNEFFFRTNFTLRTAKIVPTKRNDRSRITFAKATWEVPTGTGCLEGVGKCTLAKGGVTIDLDEVYPFTFNQKLESEGFLSVTGLGEVKFGEEMTNTTTKVYSGRIQFDRGVSAVLNRNTFGAKFTFNSGSTLKAEGVAQAHIVELKANSCVSLPAGATLALVSNLTASASCIQVVAPGYGTYTQLLYKASSSSSVDPAAFVKAAGSSAKLDKVEIVDVDATWKGVAMTFSKIQTFDVAQDVGDFVLDPGVRFKLDAGFAADTFLFPACETVFDLNGTARLVVREALSVAAGGSVVLDPTLGLSRNPKARRMPVLKVAGLTDALLAKFRVADRYAARWSIVVEGEYVWLEKADGTVVALDGTAVEPEPETDVYLLIGQSNMAGRGPLANEGDVVSSNRILKMNAAHAWVAGTEPFHYDKPDVVGVGPGGSFAQAMADARRRATIALVPAAYGGTSISQWQPGAAIIEGLSEGYTNANLYSNAVYRTREALASLPNARLCGILWHQGESDSGNQGAANAYFARYTNLIVRLRADLGCGDVPFVAGELSEFSASAYKGTVNKTLHATTNVLANVGVATSEGLTANSDNIHFNTESQRKFGFRYAAKMKEIQKNETNR